MDLQAGQFSCPQWRCHVVIAVPAEYLPALNCIRLTSSLTRSLAARFDSALGSVMASIDRCRYCLVAYPVLIADMYFSTECTYTAGDVWVLRLHLPP